MSFKDRIRSRLFRNSNGKRGLRGPAPTRHRRAGMESLEPRLCLNGTAEIYGRWLVEGHAYRPYCSGVAYIHVNAIPPPR